MSAPTWNDEFKLQMDHTLKYILKKHGENIGNPSVN